MDDVKNFVWFAWYPVRTKRGKVVWLTKVIKVWEKGVSYDPARQEYYSGWVYYG